MGLLGDIGRGIAQVASAASGGLSDLIPGVPRTAESPFGSGGLFSGFSIPAIPGLGGVIETGRAVVSTVQDISNVVGFGLGLAGEREAAAIAESIATGSPAPVLDRRAAQRGQPRSTLPGVTPRTRLPGSIAGGATAPRTVGSLPSVRAPRFQPVPFVPGRSFGSPGDVGAGGGEMAILGAAAGPAVRQLLGGAAGGAAAGLLGEIFGGEGGGAAAMPALPMGGVLFRQTPTRVTPQRTIMVPNPMNPSKLEVWKHMGSPVLFSGDFACARRVDKVARRARRRRPR